jgi:hypothetical protein
MQREEVAGRDKMEARDCKGEVEKRRVIGRRGRRKYPDAGGSRRSLEGRTSRSPKRGGV